MSLDETRARELARPLAEQTKALNGWIAFVHLVEAIASGVKAGYAERVAEETQLGEHGLLSLTANEVDVLLGESSAVNTQFTLAIIREKLRAMRARMR